MEVKFTERGDEAFDEALIFLMEDQEVPVHIVEGVVGGINDDTSKLADFPDQGRPEKDLSEQYDREYRSIPSQKNYRIVYFVDHEHDMIWITDVFDTRQDPSKMQG